MVILLDLLVDRVCRLLGDRHCRAHDKERLPNVPKYYFKVRRLVPLRLAVL